MKATAAYLRVSSDKQDVSRQRRAIDEWAARNRGIDLWFEDSTGRNSRDQAHKRKGFQKLLKHVEAGLISCIVVDSQDRFGTKDAYQWGAFLTLLRDNGCSLVDASGKELSGDDDAAVLTGTIGALTSSREQKEKAKRSIGGMLERAKRGQYVGGYPPYGMDVVCFNDGEEKWRTLYVGHYDRWKVYPDGRRERFKGKDNAPAKDAADVQHYRPSIESERLANVRQVFKWFATEAISPRQIATRLNELGIDPIFGDLWNKVKVLTMLRNPVYIGRPAWNKRAGSRFVEYVNGRIQDVAKVNGKVKLGRRRKQAEYIAADKPQFKPIIDEKTWNKVQAKIEAASAEQPAKRPAQTAELWLRPFLVCGHCDKPMRATRGGSTARLWPSYFCGTYALYGKSNPTGCRCHRVRHSVLGRLVLSYVAETSPKVAKLLTAAKAGDLEAAKPLLQAVTDATQGHFGLACDMMTFVEEKTTERELARHFKQRKSFPEIYGLLFERFRPGIESEIAEKERQLDRMLDDFRSLSPKLRERANERMEAVQAEIDRMRDQLSDLREPWSDLGKELAARRDVLKRAEHILSNGAAGRQKTEAITGVIDRIVCRFRHVGRKSFLDSVEILPVSGQAICFTDGIQPGQG